MENKKRRTRITQEEYCKKVYELVGDEYSVIGIFKNSNTKIRIKHNNDT